MTEDIQRVISKVRCITQKTETNPIAKSRKTFRQLEPNENIVLSFDTETTNDIYQKLLFGSCSVYRYGRLFKIWLFFGEELEKPKYKQEFKILKQYAKENGIELISREQFVSDVFLEYAYFQRALVIGFNLPFDISRIAISVSHSRTFPNGFSFKFSHNNDFARIAIQRHNSKFSFFRLSQGKTRKGKINRGKQRFNGAFLDLKTFGFVLRNESFSLDSALKGKDSESGKKGFNVKDENGKPVMKLDAKEHGIIKPEYIEYNLQDNRALWYLYQAQLKEYKNYNLKVKPCKLFTPASLGKACIEAIGVKSFKEKNPELYIKKELLGAIMQTFYGARTECNIRKEPVKVTYLDFTSLYPSIDVLLDLWRYIISDKIEAIDSTPEIQRFVDLFESENILEKDTWNRLTTICLVSPENDVFPVRAEFDKESGSNISIANIAKSSKPLWYMLSDVLASRILAGKSPTILKAISFVPEGIQEGLKPIRIVNKIEVNPSEDPFKKFIEERIRLKREDKEKYSASILALKIISNATSYGIYAEVNEQELKQETELEIYSGYEHFTALSNKFEDEGKMFNPLLASAITSSARLLLAIVEKKYGFVYCDTDSVFVEPSKVREIQDFFAPLYPFIIKDDFLKVEEGFDGTKLEDVWFYGISSKRYCLFNLNEKGEIRLLKFTFQGFGERTLLPDELGEKDEKGKIIHLSKEKRIWTDILNCHFSMSWEEKEKILSKYEYYPKVMKHVISTWNLFKLHKRNKSPIMPFSFFIIGEAFRRDENGNPIRPCVPLTRNLSNLWSRSFVAYSSGQKFQADITNPYWFALKRYVNDYMNHKESKLNGNSGRLQRKTVEIIGITQIGKEANKIEEAEALGAEINEFKNYKAKIQSLTKESAFRIGMSVKELYYLNERLYKFEKSGKSRLIIRKKTKRKLEKLDLILTR